MTDRALPVATSKVRADLAYEVEALLAWHDEDARAAIATLLEDCRLLRSKLAMIKNNDEPQSERLIGPARQVSDIQEPGLN